MNDLKLMNEYAQKRFAKAEKNKKRPLSAFETCQMIEIIENEIKHGFHLPKKEEKK
ncbi:MAG: hypothetical protein V1494_01155 [Candidatus Diapherotrites archaeon]